MPRFTVGGLASWPVKERIKATFRLLKALATDERVPKPIRWLIGVSLAIKAVPLPDFGIDELGLLVAFGLLVTVYRGRFAEIRADVRHQSLIAPDRAGLLAVVRDEG
jgi:hypothetical protein